MNATSKAKDPPPATTGPPQASSWDHSGKITITDVEEGCCVLDLSPPTSQEGSHSGLHATHSHRWTRETDAESNGARSPVGMRRQQSRWKSFRKKRKGGAEKPSAPGDVSVAKRLACHFNTAFWMRVALVVVLSMAVMGTALFVLRLYNANVYREASQLGHKVQDDLMMMAELHMDSFIVEMVYGALSLAGNLEGQGLVPLLPADTHNLKARRLVWETFKSCPSANAVAYGLDNGTTVFVRPGPGIPPLLLQGQPVDPALPAGAWKNSMVPVDPARGVPLPGVPVQYVPTVPFTHQAFYADALRQPPGTIFWLIEPAVDADGSHNMLFSANSVLWHDTSGAGNGSGGADQPRIQSAEQPLTSSGDVLNDSSGANGEKATTITDAANGKDISNATNASNGVDASNGEGLPPQGAGYEVIGMAGVGHDSASLTHVLRQMDLRGGRLFFASAQDGSLVMASHGGVLKFNEGSTAPLRVTVDESSDDAIAAAGRHMRRHFGGVRGGGPSEQGEDAYAVSAAAAGLCWEDYASMIHIDGRPWYLQCRGHVYGGERAPLAMAAVLIMPRASIMGDVDASREQTLVIAMGVSLSIAVIGIVSVYLSTVGVNRLAEDKQALEEEVEKQGGEIQVMARELEVMRAMLPGAAGHALDMRTPIQVVHDLLAELTEENAGPGPQTLIKIQNLLKMPEQHMPILLQQLGNRSMEPSELGSPLHGHTGTAGSEVLDADTTTWLQSVIMRLPKRRPSMLTNAAAGTRARQLSDATGDDEQLPLGSPTGAMRRSTTHRLTKELPLDSIRDVLQQGNVDPGPDDADKEDYSSRKGPRAPAQGPEFPDGFRENKPGNLGGGLFGVGAGGLMAGEPVPDVSGSAEIEAALEPVGSWNFDSWHLTSVCSGRPILWMGFELFRRLGLVKEFKLPVAKLLRFLAKLDDGMPANSYHNGTHIVDVANSLYHLIKHSGLSEYLNRFDLLAAVLAALVHDFKHPGLNNDFVVKSCDELALRYNDRTVLENFHVAEAFLLLAEPGLNFLQGLTRSDFNYVRNVVIEMVLGSDLKRHFELLEQFKERIKDKGKPLHKGRDNDRLLLLQLALKVADVGHSAKKLAIHKVWTSAITEEFYLQGDKEKAAGFRVSPFMDRENNDLPKSQLGFFSFIALPLFESWVTAFPMSRPIMEEMSANIKYWEGRRDGVPSV